MNIRDIPQFSPLATDYLTNWSSSGLSTFFSFPPTATREALEAAINARHVSQLSPEARDITATAIESLHQKLNLVSAKCTQNLALLRQANTFAVVTGQQVGVLGGPLYTFYKAITAVELARRYKERLPEFNFVPVFWLETEDHDIDEVTTVHILSRTGELASPSYIPAALAAADSDWRKQVGGTQLEQAPLDAFFAALEDALQPTEFTTPLLIALRKAYAAEHTFTEAYTELLFNYCGEDGLLFLDANQPATKRLASTILRKEIASNPQLSENIVLQSGKLEEHYHAQVKPRALNLFYITDTNERLPIVEREPRASAESRTYFLKGTRQSFTQTELLDIAEREPERFSPNVVMRPLVQDSLLPTIAYVAGPGEIAYFAQFRTAYEWAGIPMPIIAPRISATLLEDRTAQNLAKNDVTAASILAGGQAALDALMASLEDNRITDDFAAAISSIESTLEGLRNRTTTADKSLDGALTTLKGKVATTVSDFGKKVEAADRKRFAKTKEQLDRALTALLPMNALQERELSLVYFLNKYGPSFLDRIKALLAPCAEEISEHHLVPISTPRKETHDNPSQA